MLREVWLSRDTAARKWVVDELWNLGVGEGQGYPTNKDTELEFLALPKRPSAARDRS